MWRILTKMALMGLVLFATLVISAHSLGARQPINPTLTGFTQGCEGKPQPCWFGVVPGLTTEEEVYQLLEFMGKPTFQRNLSEGVALVFALSKPLPYCNAVFSVRDGVVFRGEFSLCREPNVQIGDLASILLNNAVSVSMPPEDIFYGPVAVHVKGWPSPHSRIGYITLFSSHDELPLYPWFGFMSQNRYCQLVPSYPLCRNSSQQH